MLNRSVQLDQSKTSDVSSEIERRLSCYDGLHSLVGILYFHYTLAVTLYVEHGYETMGSFETSEGQPQFQSH